MNYNRPRRPCQLSCRGNVWEGSYFELVGDIETIDKLSRMMDSIKTVSRPNYDYFICY